MSGASRPNTASRGRRRLGVVEEAVVDVPLVVVDRAQSAGGGLLLPAQSLAGRLVS